MMPATRAETARAPAGLWRRQLPLLLVVPTALLVALAASWSTRVVILQIFWPAPFYVNPFITFTYILYTGLGLLLLTSSWDRAWPFYFSLVFLWIFIVAFVDMSIIQWFELQAGIITGGSRMKPILVLASSVAVGATILLHVNQLARRLHESLRARGVDAAELAILEEESRREGHRLVTLLVGFAGIVTVVLFLAEFLVGGATLGLNVLGILSGLLVVSLFLVAVHRLLSRGPLDLDAATAGVVSAHEVKRGDAVAPPRPAGNGPRADTAETPRK